MKSFFYVLVAFLAPYFLITSQTQASDAIGVNIMEPTDYARSVSFADAMKTARGWAKPSNRYTRGGVALDENGWPTEDAAIVIHADVPGVHGTYRIFCKGKADIQAMDSGTISDLNYDASKDVTTATWTVPKGSAVLTLGFLNTNGGVKDVKVMRDWEPQGIFTKRFIEMIEPFSLIRYMDWTHTNGSKLEQWSDRSKPTDALWSDRSKGAVPLEVCIELSNKTGKDAWFCIPHLADDDFVRQMARLVRDTLDPNLKVYAEYSNELWNFQFPQTNYYKNKASKWFDEQVAAGVYTEDKRNQTMYPQMWVMIAERAAEVAKIWREEFGDTDRLVNVLGSQSAGPHIAKKMFEHKDTAQHFEALAIAPYFLHGHGYKKLADKTLEGGLDGIFADIEAELNGKNKQQIERNAQIAQQHGVALIAYEGGQHMVVASGDKERDKKLDALFKEANRDPRMADMYRLHYKNWKEAGGSLYTFFNLVSNYGPWGYWGLLESMEQDFLSIPKYKAVDDMMKGRVQ